MARTKASTNSSASKKTNTNASKGASKSSTTSKTQKTVKKNTTAVTPKTQTKIINAKDDNKGYVLKRERMQTANFARLQEILQRNVTRNVNLTFTQYTKSLIQNYLQSPANNADNIRDVSRFLGRYSMLYQKILMYLASMPLFHYNITPSFDFSANLNANDAMKDYFKVLSEFNKFHIKRELYTVLYIGIRDGIYVGYMFDSKDGADKRFLMTLDTKYVRILGRNANGEWVAYFNAAYFDAGSNREFVYGADGTIVASTWPTFFQDAYKKFKDEGREYQWFRLPPEKTCILLTGPEDEFSYPLPFLAPSFIDLCDYIDLKQLINEKSALECTRLLIEKIPLLDDNTVDDFAISQEFSDMYTKMLQDSVPETVYCIPTPMDITVESFEKSNSTADTDELAKAVANLFNNNGFSQVIVTGGGTSPSTLAVRLSMLNDLNTTWIWVNRLETWLNYYISENIKKGYILEIHKVSDYNKDEYIQSRKDAATLGGSALDYTTAIDGDPLRVMCKMKFENVIGLKDMMIPLYTSYTQSSDSSNVGRPETPDDKLTDSGERSRNA